MRHIRLGPRADAPAFQQQHLRCFGCKRPGRARGAVVSALVEPGQGRGLAPFQRGNCVEPQRHVMRSRHAARREQGVNLARHALALAARLVEIVQRQRGKPQPGAAQPLCQMGGERRLAGPLRAADPDDQRQARSGTHGLLDPFAQRIGKALVDHCRWLAAQVRPAQTKPLLRKAGFKCYQLGQRRVPCASARSRKSRTTNTASD